MKLNNSPAINAETSSRLQYEASAGRLSNSKMAAIHHLLSTGIAELHNPTSADSAYQIMTCVMFRMISLIFFTSQGGMCHTQHRHLRDVQNHFHHLHDAAGETVIIGSMTNICLSLRCCASCLVCVFRCHGCLCGPALSTSTNLPSQVLAQNKHH